MRVLVTGASGQLGGYLLRELVGRGDEVIGWSGGTERELFGVGVRAVDLRDEGAVRGAFGEAGAEVVIHGGAVSKPSEAAGDPERAWGVNVEGTRRLAGLARESGARFVYLSTDMVFDGEKGWYGEGDEARPTSVYGRTKLAGERAVLGGGDFRFSISDFRLGRGEIGDGGMGDRRWEGKPTDWNPWASGNPGVPGVCVLRLSLLVGPSVVGRGTLFDEQVGAMERGEKVRLFVDEWRTPLGLGAAARGIVATAESGAEGLFHLGGAERMSRWEMGRAMAERLGLGVREREGCLEAVSRLSVGGGEARPRDTSLDSGRWEREVGEGRGFSIFDF